MSAYCVALEGMIVMGRHMGSYNHIICKASKSMIGNLDFKDNEKPLRDIKQVGNIIRLIF